EFRRVLFRSSNAGEIELKWPDHRADLKGASFVFPRRSQCGKYSSCIDAYSSIAFPIGKESIFATSIALIISQLLRGFSCLELSGLGTVEKRSSMLLRCSSAVRIL